MADLDRDEGPPIPQAQSTHTQSVAPGSHLVIPKVAPIPPQMYFWPTCNYKSPLKHNLTRHMKRHTQKPKQRPAPKGSPVPQAPSTFTQHFASGSHLMLPSTIEEALPKRARLSEGTPKKYMCPDCSYSTNRMSDLKRHMKLAATEKAPPKYNCPECDFKTTRMSDLKRHMTAVHKVVVVVPRAPRKPPQMLYCPTCNYKSPIKNNLTRHMKTHTRKPKERPAPKTHYCPHCDYEAPRKNYVTKHMRKKHGPETFGAAEYYMEEEEEEDTDSDSS
eukprot:Platyproteum_vivax@DN3951_c0_g1_i2.p1